MLSYVQTRKDFEFLESIEQLQDWAELQGDLELLMREPTKQKAAEFYRSAIGLWFMEARLAKRFLDANAKRIRKRHDA